MQLKISPECALCILQRGYIEALEATKDSGLRFKAVSELLRMLAENFRPNAIPAVLGTMRDRIVKSVTGNRDPLAERKKMSNIEAMRVLPFAERIILGEKTGYLRFRRACLCAIVGNAIEFFIPGHVFDLKELSNLILDAEQNLAIDDIYKAYMLASESKLVVYLADNAGEIVLDKLLIRELKKLGCKVIVAVKGEPVYNDATIEDALLSGIDEVADKVVTTGTDMMGLMPSDCSGEFLEIYERADFVIAKGMGNAETITEMEIKVPHLLLLRTKCENVANFFRVERNRNVAKILYPGRNH